MSLMPIEKQLTEWRFPMYPLHRSQRAVSKRHKYDYIRIPTIEGKKLKVTSKDCECTLCATTKNKSCRIKQVSTSRPNSGVGRIPNSQLLMQPNVVNGISLNNQFRIDDQQSTLRCDSGRQSKRHHGNPVIVQECYRTNLANHSTARSNRSGVQGDTWVDSRSYQLVSRTTSLPILLEKKSVEIKPRYERKQSARRKATPCPDNINERREEEVQRKIQAEPVISTAPELYTGISVTITDKRTRNVVRASSANSTRSLRGL